MAEASLVDKAPAAAEPSRLAAWAAPALTIVLFALVFAKPALLLARDWWNDPEAGHGLLLFPAGLWLAWKHGLLPERRAQSAFGLLLLAGAVLLRLVSDLAAELFTMRLSLVGAAAALVVYYAGLRQLKAWWLPVTLLVLAIPLPELVRSGLALPLQFKASAMGASLLEWRHVPVQLTGNIIYLPGGHRLFVTEACSGLRSLTALLSLAVLMGGLWFQTSWSRLLLLALAVPIAVVINGVRVFLTGFLVFFVDPSMGEGFMHLTEGWLLFTVSLAVIGGAAALLRLAERSLLRGRNA